MLLPRTLLMGIVKKRSALIRQKGGMNMYKKISFPTFLTEFCSHVFDFTLRAARSSESTYV